MHRVMVLVVSVSLSVCVSVFQLLMMAASNGHNSETTSSKTRIGMGSVAIFDVISLLMKHEARKVTEVV